MEERLGFLKNNFNVIVDFKENNIISLQLLDVRIKKMKEIYSDFITTNRDNIFVFTLDSFHFQGKLIDIEYEDMMRLFYAITNRMYCDYYKVFKIIIEYVKENVPDKKLNELINVNDNFPLYKDLEPFKQYDFHYIQSLHEIILVILTYLNTFIINKEHDLQIYQSKNKIGLNIDNFVNTFNFKNTVMKEKAILFITYIEFFQKIHTKYLKRFTMKLQLMLSQINNDIKFENHENDKNTKNEILNDLKNTNIDKDILKQLKMSVFDDKSIVSSDKNCVSESRSKSTSNASSHDIEITNNINFEVIETNIQNEYISELTDDHCDSPISVVEFSIKETILEESTVSEIQLLNTSQSNDENTFGFSLTYRQQCQSVETLDTSVDSSDSYKPLNRVEILSSIEPDIEPNIEPNIEPIIEPIDNTNIEPNDNTNIEHIIEPIIIKKNKWRKKNKNKKKEI